MHKRSTDLPTQPICFFPDNPFITSSITQSSIPFTTPSIPQSSLLLTTPSHSFFSSLHNVPSIHRLTSPLERLETHYAWLHPSRRCVTFQQLWFNNSLPTTFDLPVSNFIQPLIQPHVQPYNHIHNHPTTHTTTQPNTTIQPHTQPRRQEGN